MSFFFSFFLSFFFGLEVPWAFYSHDMDYEVAALHLQTSSDGFDFEIPRNILTSSF